MTLDVAATQLMPIFIAPCGIKGIFFFNVIPRLTKSSLKATEQSVFKPFQQNHCHQAKLAKQGFLERESKLSLVVEL